MGRIKNFLDKIFRKKGSVLALPGDLRFYTERIIADGIFINELPSPADREEPRSGFIRERLGEMEIDNIITDEIGNIYMVFQGSKSSDKFFMIYTDMDNIKYSSSESIIEIKDNMLSGIGIGDNSLGASTLLALCEYLKKNHIILDFNLLVLFSLQNTPESNFAGINSFLKEWHQKITGSVYLFGLQLGRIVLSSTGIYNLSFFLKSSNSDALGRNYTDSAVDFAVQLYNEISKIDWNTYNAIVNIVRITAGIGFEYFPEEGTVDLEVFSQDNASLNRAREKIMELADTVARNKCVTIENRTISHIPPAVDALNDSLNNLVKKIHSQLNIKTEITHIPHYASIINQYKIPSVTIGITTGIKAMYSECADIKNIPTGFRQILRLIDELNKISSQGVLSG